jgi:2',3'-cyclic-nucleotide 2'-phosphodiesterase / 3'-nucleotidase / 5'-nucleotidase
MKLSTLLNPILLKNAAPTWAGILVAGSAAPVMAASEKNLGLKAIGSYATGIFDDASAEVVAHDPANQWLFVGNNILNWPAMGMYQPDGIAAYSFRGQPYLVTANEGDVRTVVGLTPNSATGSEDIRVGNAAYILDPSAFPNAAVLKTNAQLGRLQVSRLSGDTDGDGDFDEIHSFGGRSFSIWSSSGDLVFDSGDQFEQVVKTQLPLNFNANNTNNDRDSRSDDSGPEPECLVLGHAFGRQWAFIGLERIGGIMVYDVTDPANARFSNYVNNRNFGVRPGAGTIPPNPLPNTGDLSPESIAFIKADESPNGRPLLVVTNEVSGTTTLFEITKE